MLSSFLPLLELQATDSKINAGIFYKDSTGDVWPMFLLLVASPQLGHRGGCEPVPQARQFTACSINVSQSGYWSMHLTMNYSG